MHCYNVVMKNGQNMHVNANPIYVHATPWLKFLQGEEELFRVQQDEVLYITRAPFTPETCALVQRAEPVKKVASKKGVTTKKVQASD